MSAPEVAVLNAKVDMILSSIDEIKDQNKKNNDRLSSVETTVALLRTEHCRIQEEKKDMKRPWYSIIPSILQAVSIALILYLLALK